MIELTFKVVAILLIAAVCIVLLNGYNPSYSMLSLIAAACLSLAAVFKAIFPTVSALNSLFLESQSEGEYFTVALKSLGIAYISGFAADASRDFGQSAIAAKIELAGRCAILFLTAPLIISIAQTAIKISGL